MNNKKENKDEAGAPETVKRGKTEPGKTTVVGDHEKLFENGKLKAPKKSAEQLLKEEAAKNPAQAKKIERMEKEADAKLKKASEPKIKPEKVSIKEDKWSRITTYSTNQASSDLEVRLLNELNKLKSIQILPKDTASFKVKTIDGNHSVMIIDTLKNSFSVKTGQGEQYKVSEDKQIDTILQNVRTELERISKLPKKKVGSTKTPPSNIISKPELIERINATDGKKFHMKGGELTKTAIQYAKERKFKITENDSGYIFSHED